MGKIQLNLVGGSAVEKNLISAFKAENQTYMVLDNESTGSMGLPIILVCKIFDNKALKVVDQMEWQKVKESLKSIISGSNIEYVNVSPTMSADDVYYTQLTLPIASFEALKNNYKPTGEVPAAPASPSEPVAPVVPEPVAPVVPEPVAPVVPEPVAPVVPEPVAPVVPEPVAPVVPEPVAPVVPEPVTTASINNDINLDEIKATFMKSCENMFDAMVAKLNNK